MERAQGWKGKDKMARSQGRREFLDPAIARKHALFVARVVRASGVLQ